MSTIFSASCKKTALLLVTEALNKRVQAALIVVLFCIARFLVSCVPLRMWSATLGVVAKCPPEQTIPSDETFSATHRLAVNVERVAARLPFETRCLHRAMTLAWMLWSNGISYNLKIAVRPSKARTGRDDLHAWVEAGGKIVLGDLPGPWAVIVVLAGREKFWRK